MRPFDKIKELSCEFPIEGNPDVSVGMDLHFDDQIGIVIQVDTTPSGTYKIIANEFKYKDQ